MVDTWKMQKYSRKCLQSSLKLLRVFDIALIRSTKEQYYAHIQTHTGTPYFNIRPMPILQYIERTFDIVRSVHEAFVWQ